MKNSYEEIFEYVKGLTIIDTHEHLPVREGYRDKDTDILKEYLTHYMSSDIVSSGLSLSDMAYLKDATLPLMDRWNKVEPYWEYCRNSGYGRSLDLTVKGLYGVDKIDRNTIEELNSHFLETLSGGQYQKVLKDKSKIAASISVFNDLTYDKDFFRIAANLDYFVAPDFFQLFNNIEEEFDINIDSFEKWLEACTLTIDKYIKAGAACFKSFQAYRRSLKFEEVSFRVAEQEFNLILDKRSKTKDLSEKFSLTDKMEDYVMHYILSVLDEKGETIQFHTGLHEGNGNHISNSDPSLMTNLFLEYPNIKFDIFHISFPYQNVIGAIVKNFQNVYVDMCWSHIISPSISVETLYHWLDTLPLNKISAFGGDYCMIDPVYGHQLMARENVSRSLSRRVDEGYFDVSSAKKYASMFFYENPVKIFRLGL